MPLNQMQITVVGAGIGGLAAALALSAKGAQVTVLEQAAQITEVGAGLQISPNGLAVIRALGLEQELAACSVRAQGVSLRDFKRGKEVFHLDLNTRVSQPYHFVHRADLIGLLLNAAAASGVTIKTNAKVARIRPNDRPRIDLESGQIQHSDLVIAADGLHSVLRPVLNGVSAPQFTGQVAWRALVPNLIGHPPEARVHMGPGCHLVSYPIRDGHTLNIVAVQERESWAPESWTHSDSGDALRTAFARFGSEITQMLAGIGQVGLWGLFSHPVAHRWHGPGCALVGDAAHPMLPFMAQGANMALEDAWVLADALGKSPTDGLADYQTRRQQRVERVVTTAAGNAAKYHLRFPPLRFAAHTGMRIASKLMATRMQRQFDWLYAHDVTSDI